MIEMTRCGPNDYNTTSFSVRKCIRGPTGEHHGVPVMKCVTSCGCTLLFCNFCMTDKWVVRGVERDIYWWAQQYGKMHGRRDVQCHSRKSV
jgi:hypothetical protein